MADIIIGSYQKYVSLMALYRVNMGGAWKSTWTQAQKDNYTYWREQIKDLRYYAVQEGIDLYTLEYDSYSRIRNDGYDKEIAENRAEIATLQAELNKTSDTKKINDIVLKQRTLQNEIYTLETKKQEELTPAQKAVYKPYIEEAYNVAEMVALRQRWDNATAPERDVMRDDAHHIRIRVVAEMYGGVDDPMDWERRVWKMYKGYDISTSTDPEDIALWEGQKKLMQKAIDEVKAAVAANGKDILGAMRNNTKTWEKQYDIDNWNSKWKTKKYETFSGADMTVFFAFPGYKPIDVGTASLISYSIYREKKQFRTIGAINTKGITKGARTISGRMVFTVVREHIVETIRRLLPYTRDVGTMLMDELPPFDILVSFGNEYGGSAGLVIQGVTFVDEQKTLTVEDMYTENIFTYLARGIEPMREQGTRSLDSAYNPLEWYSTSFIPVGSEALGYFKVDELTLATMGNLIDDPIPFFGTAAGWNADLYDEMYGSLGGNAYVDSPTTSIGDGGTTTTGGDVDKKSKYEDYGTDKLSRKKDFIWLNIQDGQTNFEANSKHFFAGFMGLDKDDYKERQWASVVPSTSGGLVTKIGTHAKLEESIRKAQDGDPYYGKKTGDLEISLGVKVADGGVLTKGSQTYKAAVTFELVTQTAYTAEAGPYKDGDWKDRQMLHAMLGFYKKRTTFEDQRKVVITAHGKGTEKDREEFQTTIKNGHWVDEKGTKHTVKNKKVGALPAVDLDYFRKTHSVRVNDDGSPQIVTIKPEGTRINLEKYLYFSSSITPAGTRLLLTYDELPNDATVLVKFTYDAYHPNDPLKTDEVTDKRYFYIFFAKPDHPYDKKNDIHKKHEFFKAANFDTSVGELSRWNLYNKPLSVAKT